MNGKSFIFLFLSGVVVFTAALFYFQNYAYYDSTDIQQDFLLGNKRYNISKYQGIDSESSALKLRECFVIDSLDNFDLSKLKEVFENKNILKVIHSCKQDLEVIFLNFDSIIFRKYW